MKKTFFSIIVVSFNAGEKLHTTLQSIYRQSCHDYEVIIKDALSDDGSVEKLEQRADTKLFSCRDKGIYDGMNQALEQAEGRFVYFLNCGDLLHDEKVLKRVREKILAEEGRLTEADRNLPGVYYGDVTDMLTGQPAAAKPVMNDFALFRNIPCHQACFYERDLFAERGFDLRYAVRADYEHFLWCYYVKKAHFHHIGEVIADYEGGGFSESEKGSRLSAAEHRQITERYMPGRKVLLFRAYLFLTLQPLREKLARGKYTAVFYQRLKRRMYHRG